MRATHDDGVELTFDNVVSDSSLYAYTAVMCGIESKKIYLFQKIESNRNIFLSESEYSVGRDRLKPGGFVFSAENEVKPKMLRKLIFCPNSLTHSLLRLTS